MADAPWTATPYSAAAKRRSMEETRDRARQELREAEERAAQCGCEVPIPGRVYLKHTLCERCQRFIPQ